MTDILLVRLENYRHILEREFKYPLQVQKHFIFQPNFQINNDTSTSIKDLLVF